MQNDAADREFLHAADNAELIALWQDTGGSD
jgi:hypothetical protein